ncbi:hypothetical protein GCM10011611_50730 [Aliidongia dinghuensis]|uniref:Uncharacterized protein n=1 Tax=Aliidongia dinghuensis TaxID=1867774 RepID=A0A8J2YYF3_9PROT|nr:hypothetical protein [Aliidongia dinghuensis]GGF38219.1 hypothetical protein GCM10011611_50730 [Aliidongia dinghuensis]
MKLAIVDHALVDLNGHHYEYDGALAAAGRARGVAVTVLANRGYDGPTHEFEILPWFGQGYYDLTSGGRARRAAYRALSALPEGVARRLHSGVRIVWNQRHRRRRPVDDSFGRDFLSACEQLALGPDDHALVHTIGVDELDALVDMLGTLDRPWPWIHLQLVRRVEELGAGRPRERRPEAVLARLLEGPAAGRIRFYSDTAELAEIYRCLIDRPVGVLPIAFRHDLILAAVAAAPARVPGTPITVGYLGNARLEKGFQHLPDLVEQVTGRLGWAGRVRFRFQSPFNIPSGEPGIGAARARLGAFPVDLVALDDRVLTTEQYYEMLAELDVLVLPYDGQRYDIRSSGILVQARVAGKPMVAPEGSWIARQVPAPAGEAFRGPGDLADALARLLRRYEAARAAAAADALVWRAEQSPERYLDHLFAAAEVLS